MHHAKQASQAPIGRQLQADVTAGEAGLTEGVWQNAKGPSTHKLQGHGPEETGNAKDIGDETGLKHTT